MNSDIVAILGILVFCINVAALVSASRTPRDAYQRAGYRKGNWIAATVFACLFSVTLVGVVIGLLYFLRARPRLSAAT